MPQRQGFLRGTLTLTLANLVNRILGFAFRILSIRLVGAEGIGIYEMVFPVYSLLLVITTAGIPVALSKVIAEQVATGQEQRADRLFRLSAAILFFSGLVVSLITVYFLPQTERLFSDQRSSLVFWVIVPALTVVSLSSACRSFFQGLQAMTPIAHGQILEQIIRTIIGLWLAQRLLAAGVEFAAVGLALGMLAGESGGLLYLLLQYKRYRSEHYYQKRQAKKRLQKLAGSIFYLMASPFVGRHRRLFRGQTGTVRPSLLQQMLNLALPVTAMRVLAAASLTIQARLIPSRLQVAGLDWREATEVYGQYAGVAASLINLPTVLTFSLAISLIPAVSEALARQHEQILSARWNQAIRLTLITGLPFTALFYFLAEDLTKIIFTVPEAAVPLKILALGAGFLYLQPATNATLQGLGLVKAALIHSLIGSLIVLGGIYFLTGIPAYGIKGAAVGAVVSAATITLLNINTITRHTGVTLDLRKAAGKPLQALVVMSIVLYSWQQVGKVMLVPGWADLIIAMIFGLGSYLIILILNKGLKLQELKHFLTMGKPN